MSQKSIGKLIINGAHTEPTQYWTYVRETQEFELRDGRRPAGYWRTSGVGKNAADDPGEFVPLELVNKIRPRVEKWRENGYPNVSGTTRKLLESIPSLKQELWGASFWSSGFYASTVGRKGNEQTISQYVKEQGREKEYMQIHKNQLKLFI